MSAVKALVGEDGRYTVEEKASKVEILEGSTRTILTKNLGMIKVCSRLLTTDQKKQNRLFKKASQKVKKNCDDKVISNLLTGDETWVYVFKPQRRSDNRQWRLVKKPQKCLVIDKRKKCAKKVFYSILWSSGIYYWEVLQQYFVEQQKKKKHPSVGLKEFICFKTMLQPIKVG